MRSCLVFDIFCLNVHFFSYFINHYTKTTSWEDPRDRYQQIGKPTAKVSSTGSFLKGKSHAMDEVTIQTPKHLSVFLKN
jgi:hypothetical protein